MQNDDLFLQTRESALNYTVVLIDTIQRAGLSEDEMSDIFAEVVEMINESQPI